MARLVINSDDFTAKLKEFSLKCNECGSENVTLDIDWAAYPSASWFTVEVICEDCKKDEKIYSTD
jgi:hypothetical protein